MIVDRYLTREVAKPFVAICAGLCAVYGGYRAVDYLADAARGLLDPATVAAIIGLNTLIALEVLVPVALYLSIVVGIGRLHADHEMTALAGCGMGEGRLLRALGVPIAAAAVLVGALSVHARPAAYAQRYLIEARAEASFDIGDVEAGRFYKSAEGARVVFVEGVDPARDTLLGVFVWLAGEDEIAILRAEAVTRTGDVDGPPLRFKGLSAYRIDRADGTISATAYADRLASSLGPDDLHPVGYKRKAAPTGALLGSGRSEDVAELQWRLSRPLSVILVAVLALRLGSALPRRARYRRVFLAVVAYFAYYQLGVVAKNWVERGTVDPFPGIFWVDGLLGLLLLLGFPRAGMAGLPARLRGWRRSRPSPGAPS